MKRIQRLHLRNFKAFRDQEFDFTGDDPNSKGRHVLIYGGNGSGKSSIYWALYTLFETSGKDDVRKYFAEADPTDSRKEAQSLRHVDAPTGEPSFIELTWADPAPSNPDPAEANGTYRISATENTAYADRTLREASRSSDFVTYRLFQHFNGSNRHEVNVWPAFVRDIFPYYTVSSALFVHPAGNPFAGKPLTYLEALDMVVAKYAAIEPARTAAAAAEQAAADSAVALAEKKRLAAEAEGESEFGELEIGEEATDETAAAAQQVLNDTIAEYQNHLGNFNLEVVRFIGEIATRTNTYLTAQQQLPGHAHSPLQIALEYPAEARLGPGIVKSLAAPDTKRDDFASLLRRDQPDQLLIRLTVASQRSTQTHTIERPQTFLNEARLTQLAFALRVGALLDRNPLSRFNVLCLDDVLLSLDMANRLEVLDWLFSAEIVLSGSSGNRLLLDHYQIFFFTHDQELYRTVQHYIKTRSKRREWNMYELTSRMRNGQPGVYPIGEGESLFIQAHRHFDQNELAACANALRSLAEKKIKEFLPFNQTHYLNDESFWKSHTLAHLIDELQKTFTKHNERFGILQDLKLYKDLLLNPLSHDNQHTTVHEAELERLLGVVMPELEKLRSEVRLELRKEGPTELQITEAVTKDERTEQHVFTFQLGENWRLLTFPSGAQYALDPVCWLRKHEVDGVPHPRFFPKDKPIWQPLSELYNGRCEASGATQRPLIALIQAV